MDIYYPKDNAVSHGKVHELLDPEGALRKGEQLTEESIRWLLELHGEIFLIEQHYSTRTSLRRLALNGTPVAEFPDTEPMVDFQLGSTKIRMGFTVREKGILYELFVNGRRFEELTQALPSPIASCAEGSGMTFGEPIMYQRLGLLPPHLKEVMTSPIFDTFSSSQPSDLYNTSTDDILGTDFPYNQQLPLPPVGLLGTSLGPEEVFGLGLGTLSGVLGASYAWGADAGTSSFIPPPPVPPTPPTTRLLHQHHKRQLSAQLLMQQQQQQQQQKRQQQQLRPTIATTAASLIPESGGRSSLPMMDRGQRSKLAAGGATLGVGSRGMKGEGGAVMMNVVDVTGAGTLGRLSLGNGLSEEEEGEGRGEGREAGTGFFYYEASEQMSANMSAATSAAATSVTPVVVTPQSLQLPTRRQYELSLDDEEGEEEEEEEEFVPCFKRGRSMPATERLRCLAGGDLPSTGSMSDLKSATGLLLRPPLLQKSLSTSDVMERPPKLKIVVPPVSNALPRPPMCRPR